MQESWAKYIEIYLFFGKLFLGLSLELILLILISSVKHFINDRTFWIEKLITFVIKFEKCQFDAVGTAELILCISAVFAGSESSVD